MARNLSDTSPICTNISANFKNLNHLLECKYRHFLKSETVPQVMQFSAGTRYLIEILYVVSPIWFEVRILEYENANGLWCDCNSGFDEFSAKLNEFYRNSFVPVENILAADRNLVYVVRKGNRFMRCTILDTK